MKKGIIFLALTMCMFLAGCTSGGAKVPKEDKEIVKIKQLHQNAAGFEAKVGLTLSYSQQSSFFRLSISSLTGGKTTVSVLEPAYMSGFSVVTQGEKAQLLFDGEPYEDRGGLEQMPVSVLGLLEKIAFVQLEQTGKKEGDAVFFQREENTEIGPFTYRQKVDMVSAFPLEGDFTSSLIKGKITFEQFSFLENTDGNNNDVKQ